MIKENKNNEYIKDVPERQKISLNQLEHHGVFIGSSDSVLKLFGHFDMLAYKIFFFIYTY